MDRVRTGPTWHATLGCAASIALLGALAWITGTPWLFPSLGPTAYLLFGAPSEAAASGRRIVLGHTIAVACGFGALLVTGLYDQPSTLVAGVDGARVLAATGSITACGALLVRLRAMHPPAGATTLIVSMGMLQTPAELAIMVGAVALLVVLGALLTRALGLPVPRWRHADDR
ncbi:MAG: HPP family protein [Deltaproteobacteria bacterium]|nr:HPP family protein [Deltaproteobacteria bacterium]MBK8235002.1 HPP family protein [Deltaproteobacteria bacterium]MBK8716686.1 HPP family protein [Deltaproteobacteria bacterium]MBP7285347.1 HPP family protein [Nannocystaceae bacterium]